MNTVYRIFRSTLLTVAAVLGVISILVFALSLIFGVKALNVMSGSMEPGIPTGSLILTKPIPASEVSVGDIVTTERTSGTGLITHRVAAIEETADHPGAYEMRLQGDANQTEDPQPYYVEQVGAYILHIPALGFVSTVLKTRIGVFVGVAAAAFLILLVIFEPKRARPETNFNLEEDHQVTR